MYVGPSFHFHCTIIGIISVNPRHSHKKDCSHLWTKVHIFTFNRIISSLFHFVSHGFHIIRIQQNSGESWIFFLWLIIIINTNMNTSYTINTALSKGVESITRHHSPLTTEYISFEHIYKSYSERERKQREKTGVRD